MSRRSSLAADRIDRLLLIAVASVPALGLALFFIYPLLVVGAHSFVDDAGAVTLANYRQLWYEPGIWRATWHSLLMSSLVTIAAVVAGLLIAMTLYRSRVSGKRLMRAALLLPLLAPSLTQGLGLIFLLGRNGLIHRWTGWPTDIYGLPGLLMANFAYVLPQVVIIVGAALVRTDRRIYEMADSMGASRWRCFVDITLPQARFGLLAAGFIAFTLSFTDFGNAIVVGGSYRLLATEIYDQVAGQMNLGMGATVGLLLLLPALFSLALERAAARRAGQDSEHALVLRPEPASMRDLALGVGSALVLLPLVAVFTVVIYASLITLWPYQLDLTLAHYHTNLTDGYTAIFTSFKIAVMVAIGGTALLFMLAWGARALPPAAARLAYVLATLPAAVPGLVVGIGYLLAFNTGPLSSWLVGSLGLVALCNLYHHHAQGYLTLANGFRSVPGALGDAAACLGSRPLQTLRDVVLPFTTPALISVGFFLFMQSMVTLSAVIFLVTPTLNLASVAVMQLDENGFVSQAAAYSTCIVLVVAAAMGALQLIVDRLRRGSYFKEQDHVA